MRSSVATTVAPSRNCTLPVTVAGETAAVNVTAWPTNEEWGHDATDAFDGALLMVSVNPPEVLARWVESPEYTAVIKWEPPWSVEVLNVALPEFKVLVPSKAEPSKKLTVPVAKLVETVAVNCTAWP